MFMFTIGKVAAKVIEDLKTEEWRLFDYGYTLEKKRQPYSIRIGFLLARVSARKDYNDMAVSLSLYERAVVGWFARKRTAVILKKQKQEDYERAEKIVLGE